MTLPSISPFPPSLFPFLCGSYIYGGPLWKTDNDEVNSPREQFFFPCHPSTHQGKPRSRVLRHPASSHVLLLFPFLKQKYCITFITVTGLLMSEVTSDVILPCAFPGYPQGISLFIHAKAGHRHTKPNWNWVRSSKQTSSIFKVKHWATVNHEDYLMPPSNKCILTISDTFPLLFQVQELFVVSKIVLQYKNAGQ